MKKFEAKICGYYYYFDFFHITHQDHSLSTEHEGYSDVKKTVAHQSYRKYKICFIN